MSGFAAGQAGSEGEGSEPSSSFTQAVAVEPSLDERLRTQVELVESDRALDEAVREALLVELSGTRALLERAATRRLRIESLEREAASREEILAAISAEFSLPVTDTRVSGPEAGIPALAANAAEVEDGLVSAIAALIAARRAETQLSGRAPTIAKEIADALRRSENSARWAPSDGAMEGGDSVSRTLLHQSHELIEQLRWREGVSAVVELRRELAILPAQRAITSARALLAAERVTRLTRVLERRQSALGDARVRTAAADVIAAAAVVDAAEAADSTGTDNRIADGQPSASSPLANLAHTRRRLELAREERQGMRNLARARADLVELYGVRSLIESVTGSGLAADDLAGLLRGLDERLPDRQELIAKLESASRARSVLQAERFGWDERLRERTVDDPLGVADSLGGGRDRLLGDPLVEPSDNASERSTGGGATSISGNGTDDSNDAAETIVETEGSRAEGTRLLIALIGDANRLSEQLTEQEIALQESLVRADNIQTFLSRSLLGLRTGESVGLAWLARLPAGIARLTDLSAWRNVGTALLESITRFPLRALSFLAIVVALLYLGPRLRRRLRELANLVGHVGRDRHWVTPAALLISLPRAMPLPLVLGLLSLQLGLSGERGELAPALGIALGKIAPVLFVILLVRVFARPDGLLHAHFGWSPASALSLRRHLLWLGWTLLTAGLLLVLAFDAGQADLRHGIGVAALLAVSIALALFVHACFHPSTGVASLINPDTPSPRLMVALYPLLVFAPLAVGALSLVGYFETAVALQLRIVGSLLLVMAVVVAHGLARRAYLVAHRRLSLRRVRQLRARRKQERVTGATQLVSGQASPLSLDESEEVALDLARVERQTRRILADVAALLLLLGLWLVWRSLLPAFDSLETPGFGPIPSSVAAQTGVNGAAATIAPDGISLRGVILALFLITVGLIASRNIRGILELSVFERLRLDAGARYAIVAITGYVFVGASLVVGLSQLGVDWSKLQWIVAALGVGLGFGLQEIVANFVSGLIILFERPVRVGDVVTIGNLSGTVSNIRIRATTITNFDNLEVMLPNKTIITENVTNWTLSDSVTRIILSVGVAFDSDVKRVRSLLEGAIVATDGILDEPEWAVFFMRYGENALIFELRVFVPTPEHRLPVTHELNARLTEALTTAGIEIPHPQRSVTLREIRSEKS